MRSNLIKNPRVKEFLDYLDKRVIDSFNLDGNLRSFIAKERVNKKWGPKQQIFIGFDKVMIIIDIYQTATSISFLLDDKAGTLSIPEVLESKEYNALPTFTSDLLMFMDLFSSDDSTTDATGIHFHNYLNNL